MTNKRKTNIDIGVYGDIFVGHDGDYKKIESLKNSGEYCFGTCYDISWGFILPCKSGMIWEQQTDGCCCHHVYIEGILLPLDDVIDTSANPFVKLISKIPDLNYTGKSTKKVWEKIVKQSHINFKFVSSPVGMPPNQEGFEWVVYTNHDEGWGQSFSIKKWVGKPIVLVYPNSD